MYVDVCFPKNNEEQFILVAESVGIKGLCFLYDENFPVKNKISELKEKSNVKLFFCSYGKKIKGSDGEFNINITRDIRKESIYVFDYMSEVNKSFHMPLKEINQVIMKDLAEMNCLVCIKFSKKSEYEKNPEIIEKIKFVLELCEKYSVNLCCSSFAKNPYDLRNSVMLNSFFRLIFPNNNIIKRSFFSLDKHLLSN